MALFQELKDPIGGPIRAVDLRERPEGEEFLDFPSSSLIDGIDRGDVRRITIAKSG